MNSILIIRPSSIGDIVMAWPMVTALRKAYPEAHLAWLVEPGAIDLLRHNSELDEVIPWDKTHWKNLWKKGRILSLVREVLNFSKNMRSWEFDLALDAQGLLRSRILAWLSGARERVGFESREPGRFLMTRIISRGPSNKRMGSEYYHMIEALGLSPAPFITDLALSQNDRLEGEKMIRKVGIQGKYATICPFTTRPQKHWVRNRWGLLATAIEKSFGLPVVMLGGPGDMEEGSLIQSQARGKLFDLTGKPTLAQSAAIISKSTLAVGVDTGLTHMAVAFNRPTIAIFGATCPYLHSENAKALVLYKKLSCSPCKRSPTCNGAFTCMKSIEVQDVLDAAQSLIGNS
jgi:heptosyltransferase-1